MIYFCADDYGLSTSASSRIQQCIEKGALGKVSVFLNFDKIDLNEIKKNKDIRAALHLNLVEGKCLSQSDEIYLLADEKGNLIHDFIGLLKISLIHPKELELQAYKEIRAQVSLWKSMLPKDEPVCIDAHQHVHMIPPVFRALIKVLQDEEIALTHMRIPAEPIMPYIMTPSLYLTYRPTNLIKQWLLKFLWCFNKKEARKHKIPTPHFFGILFSGKMDEKRVSKVLPKYIKLAEKDGKDIEVLFHPGAMNQCEVDCKEKNIVFNKFYLSPNRQTEFDSVIKISERRVQK